MNSYFKQFSLYLDVASVLLLLFYREETEKEFPQVYNTKWGRGIYLM